MLVSTFLTVQFFSCTSREQDENVSRLSNSESVLQKYASEHNDGLDYIKSDMEKAAGLYTMNRMDSVFKEYIASQYGKGQASEILKNILPVKERVINGDIPSLKQTRSTNDSYGNANTVALQALNDCMKKIDYYLNGIPEDKLFDNSSVLSKLHSIIKESYVQYSGQCKSDDDFEVLAQTLGVLYGSIEYWTNSYNVDFWSKIITVGDEDISPEPTLAPSKSDKKDDKKGDGKGNDKDKGKDKKDDKELSTSEWIQTVAAADAIGAILGGGAASGPAAVAASAAAAAYFDVKK